MLWTLTSVCYVECASCWLSCCLPLLTSSDSAAVSAVRCPHLTHSNAPPPRTAAHLSTFSTASTASQPGPCTPSPCVIHETRRPPRPAYIAQPISSTRSLHARPHPVSHHVVTGCNYHSSRVSARTSAVCYHSPPVTALSPTPARLLRRPPRLRRASGRASLPPRLSSLAGAVGVRLLRRLNRTRHSAVVVRLVAGTVHASLAGARCRCDTHSVAHFRRSVVRKG